MLLNWDLALGLAMNGFITAVIVGAAVYLAKREEGKAITRHYADPIRKSA